MSGGKHVGALAAREAVMSEAKRRKQAVWVRAGRGVVGRWVVRKAESQVGVGVRDLADVSWEASWEGRFDMLLLLLMMDARVR